MNIAALVIFILAQVVLRYILVAILGAALSNIYGILAYCLIMSLIVSFLAALFGTPRQFRKDFYRHPGFHKMMLVYFAVFLTLNLILNIRTFIG